MEQPKNTLEVWMRGPIPNIPILLQPVAHALLQVEEDIMRYLEDTDENDIWIKPAGSASIGFHVKHIVGVIDRMFTYAKEAALSPIQFEFLANEGKEDANTRKKELLQLLHNKVQEALLQLQQTDLNQLTHERYLGRKRIPTTLIGLLFHAAEHTQRHVGQLLVTARWIKDQ